MVFAETKDGMTVLKGRNDNEWVSRPGGHAAAA